MTRLYPFGEGSEVNYIPNPFDGWRRYVFAVDEWAHRHHLARHRPFLWLCNWWDKRIV